jgi:hypothetical protein
VAIKPLEKWWHFMREAKEKLAELNSALGAMKFHQEDLSKK